MTPEEFAEQLAADIVVADINRMYPFISSKIFSVPRPGCDIEFRGYLPRDVYVQSINKMFKSGSYITLAMSRDGQLTLLINVEEPKGPCDPS